MYIGDFPEDYATLNYKFTTRTTAGVPFALGGTPVISIYESNSVTQITAGITLTVGFDGVTGLNNILVDLSASALYTVDTDFQFVITTGTVNGVSVVGEVVGSFSIERAGGVLALLKNGTYGLDKLVRSTTPANTLNVDANNRAESLLGAVTHTGAVIPTVSTLSGHTAQSADHASILTAIAGYLDTEIAAIITHLLDVKGTGFAKDTHSLPQCLTATSVTVSDKTGFSLAADQSGVTIGVCSSNTDMRGTDSALLASSAPTNFGDLAITVTTGKVTVGTNDDKTGYALTQAFPTNFSTLGIEVGGAISTLNGHTVQTADHTAAIAALATHCVEIKGATFSEATDSLEAVRNRGDAAWTTGSGGTPPALLQSTTIATLASQISFTLTAGSADDDAYSKGVSFAIVTDQTTSTQKCVGTISGYVGATKTVTLAQDPGVFTIAIGDTIDIIAGATASSVADEPYTGSTHNLVNSLARRIRNLQEFGSYDNNSVWIDTIGGSAGTTDYENGTILNPVDSIADANTVAASLNLAGRVMIPGSSITLAAAQNNQTFLGDNWTLALGGQSISATVINGANVSGICTGASMPEFFSCHVNAVTVPPCRFIESDIEGVITMPVGTVDFHHCAGKSGGTLDFGATVANTTVNWTDFSGELVVDNLGQNGTDVLNIRGHGTLTLNASCVGGTINWQGHFTISNNGSGITIDGDDITTAALAVKAVTDLLPDAGALTSLAQAGVCTEARLAELGAANLPAGIAAIFAAVDSTGVVLTAAERTALVTSILTTQMTESYAANGVAPTLAQAQFANHQMLMDFLITGTSLTVRKLDGATTAFVVTLNDASAPSGNTRS